MPYTSSSKQPETAWARHLDQVRRDRGWSATELFRQVRVELGLKENSRSTFVAELHHDPKPHWIAGLVKLFGEPPAPESGSGTETPEPPPDLATAIVGLTKELSEWRREREELVARVEGLEELVGRLTAQVAGASRGRPVPDGTAE